MRTGRLEIAGYAARAAGFARLTSALAPPNNIRIALLHVVDERDLARFDRIIRYLTASRRPIAPDELFRHYDPGNRRAIKGRSLLVSFDDGLQSAYHATKRVLEPLGIKAVFFVPTVIFELETEDDMREFAWERVYHHPRPGGTLHPAAYLTMTRAQVLDLDRAGHSVFPHTHLHTNLSEIETVEDVQRELIRPREILEDLLQKPAHSFAFPVGTESVVSSYAYYRASETYTFCFTALAGANTDDTSPHLLRRDAIHPWHSLRHVRNVADGVFDPYFEVKARLLRKCVVLPPSAPPRTPGPSAQAQGRTRFVTRVARALHGAGVTFVLLHGRAGGDDTDIDIAVDAKGFAVVDALVRLGTFGQLIQAFDYAAPRCRYYVLRGDEPGRRYRQLDVVCDPLGIGKDGVAVPVALASAAGLADDVSVQVPSAAAETLYLAVKKARKRLWSDRDRAILQRSFERDPRGSATALGQRFGAAGQALAAALGRRQPDVARELELLRCELARQRRRPLTLARRAYLEATRALGRVLRPTGLAVSIVGPDGVGKSTLADRLVSECSGAFRRSRKLHLRPGLLPPPASLVGRPAADPTTPHARPPSGPATSLLRLAYLWLDVTVGWWPKVWLPRLRSGLVIVERGWLDLAVDPLRYRLSVPRRLVRMLGAVLPGPDLVLIADVPAATAVQRKAELPVAEVERQLDAWRRLEAAHPDRIRRIDAAGTRDETTSAAADVVDGALSARQNVLASCELALRCLGGFAVGGSRYTIIFARRGPEPHTPRWILPFGFGAPGPIGWHLYRPAGLRHHAQALALEALQRAGLGLLGTQAAIDPRRGVAPLIAEALGRREVTLAAANTGDPRRGARALLSVWSGGEVVAFAKATREERDAVAHEAEVLAAIRPLELATLRVPEALDLLDWEGITILLLAPLRIRGRADRDLGPPELAGLVELSKLRAALSGVLRGRQDLVPVHGDFTPWNCARGDDGRLVLWDWEAARLGNPLEDYFHWRAQRLLRLGHGSFAELERSAESPDRVLLELCERLGVDPSSAPDALRSCLDRESRRPSGRYDGVRAAGPVGLATEGAPA